MWDKLTKSLAMFSSAVVTGTDAEGYPFSVRCTPQVDPAQQVLHIPFPNDLPIEPGPAGLLCHSHDEGLWNLKSFIARGRLEREANGWMFHPRQLIPGAGMGGLPGFMRWIMSSRRAAKQYLEKRGLPRPTIPWKAIAALRAESKRSI